MELAHLLFAVAGLAVGWLGKRIHQNMGTSPAPATLPPGVPAPSVPAPALPLPTLHVPANLTPDVLAFAQLLADLRAKAGLKAYAADALPLLHDFLGLDPAALANLLNPPPQPPAPVPAPLPHA